MTAIRLSYPVKALWPNGRAHRMAKARAVKAAREEAWAATLAVRENSMLWGSGSLNDYQRQDGEIRLQITLHPKPRGPVPDGDNCLAALKAHFDGIADALKVNDRRFIPQPVEIGERKPGGEVVIRIPGAAE